MDFKYKQYLIHITKNEIIIFDRVKNKKEVITHNYLVKMITYSSPCQLFFNGHSLEVARYISWYCMPQFIAYENAKLHNIMES